MYPCTFVSRRRSSPQIDASGAVFEVLQKSRYHSTFKGKMPNLLLMFPCFCLLLGAVVLDFPPFTLLPFPPAFLVGPLSLPLLLPFVDCLVRAIFDTVYCINLVRIGSLISKYDSYHAISSFLWLHVTVELLARRTASTGKRVDGQTWLASQPSNKFTKPIGKLAKPINRLAKLIRNNNRATAYLSQ
jgi:hypothetical protein